MRLRILIGLGALACTALALGPPAEAATPARPNIVLVVTDDQRRDTLDAMPTVRREVVGRGVTFTEAVVVNPICCPSRATILTGRDSHSTGVYANSGPHGGSDWFDHADTIAVALQKAGYRTAYLGKYLNGYGGWLPPALDRWFLPPGWDVWLAGSGGGDLGDRFTVHGLMARFPDDEAHYFTDVLADAAVSFLDQDERTPFFLVVAPHAPHHPATPAPRHAGAFAGLEPWRPASYDEANVFDKPRWVRAQPRLTPRVKHRLDALRERQLETLLAVDEAVAQILASLRASGRLPNTLVVLTSDNGLHWGEHRLANRKSSPYEESVRVPLVVRWDRVAPWPRTDDRLVGNVDLAPTFADAAGATMARMDGESLLPLLSEREGAAGKPWRSSILVESMRGVQGTVAEVPTYCALRGHRWKYVVYATRDEELYDLAADQAELENLAFDRAHFATRARLRAELVRLCRPEPPGLDLSWLRG